VRKPDLEKLIVLEGYSTNIKEFGYLNALIITPAPSETIPQFTDDLFCKFGDFIGINIVEIKTGKDFETMTLTNKTLLS
jgi:hypothetical protein